MEKNNCTRREFLKAASLSVPVIALGMPSCASDAQASSERQAFTFAQLCDTQLGMGGYEHDLKTFKQAVAQINALKPDFVVICGDLVNTPDEKSFADFNAVKAEIAVPCHCAPGNHDVGSQPTPESLQYYRKVIDKDYYSFERRGYVFVIVNTQLWKTSVEDQSSKQDSWLESVLEAASSNNAPIFVVGHHPLFLEHPDEAESYMNLPLARRKVLLGLFEKRGVAAVLGGHTHRLVVKEHKGIQLVNGETTSKNFDARPLGFRVWHVADPRPFTPEFVPLEGSQ